MQTLGVSVKQLRRKLLELGARILHVQGSKPRDMALVVRVSKMCFLSASSVIDALKKKKNSGFNKIFCPIVLNKFLIRITKFLLSLQYFM